MKQVSLPAQFPPVELLAIATDAAGRTGTYVSLKTSAGKAWLICRANQGHAAQVTFTPMQAKDVAGTGAKAINAVPIWTNQDRAAGDALTQVANAANYQLSAALKSKIVIFEIVPEVALDVNNGFDCITVQTSASNAANITEAELQSWLAYQQASPPSQLVN